MLPQLMRPLSIWPAPPAVGGGVDLIAGEEVMQRLPVAGVIRGAGGRERHAGRIEPIQAGDLRLDPDRRVAKEPDRDLAVIAVEGPADIVAASPHRLVVEGEARRETVRAHAEVEFAELVAVLVQLEFGRTEGGLAEPRLLGD